MIKSYDSIKQFQKDAALLAKANWYVKQQTAIKDGAVGVLLGAHHEKLVVTYERSVSSKV